MSKVQSAYQSLLDPNAGYDENGLWNGMTKPEVEKMCAEIREKTEAERVAKVRQHFLLHWVPSSLPS